MYADVYDKFTHAVLGRIYICHGCGCRSKLDKRSKKTGRGLPKSEDLPNGWTTKDELYHPLPTDKRRRRMSCTTNYYCRTCSDLGVTARIVAQVAKKLLPKAVPDGTRGPGEAGARRGRDHPGPGGAPRRPGLRLHRPPGTA